MENETLCEQLDRIFKNELASGNNRCYKKVSGIISSPRDVSDVNFLFETSLLEENPRNYTLEFPNLDLLFKLYNKIRSNPENKNLFIIYLNTRTGSFKGDPFYQVGYLAFETLLKLGFLAEAFGALVSKMGMGDPFDGGNELTILDEIIKHESNKFTEEQLRYIERIISIDPIAYNIKKFSTLKILDRINQVFYLRIKKEVETEINPQINQDKEVVKEKLKNFGFPKLLSDTLDKIDQVYFDHSTDKFDYSSAIKILRQFWNDLVSQIADKIKSKTLEEFPTTQETPIANKRVYIRKHLALDKENQLINGLVKILHKEGGHKLISDKEYFRLSRNITIEVALLILSKLDLFSLENTS